MTCQALIGHRCLWYLPEIGFMTNPQEDQKLSDEAYLTHLMELLTAGIEEYANKKQAQRK